MSKVIKKDNYYISISNHQVHEPACSVTGQSFHCTLNFVCYFVPQLFARALLETQRPLGTAAALEQSKIQEQVFVGFLIVIKPA